MGSWCWEAEDFFSTWFQLALVLASATCSHCQKRGEFPTTAAAGKERNLTLALYWWSNANTMFQSSSGKTKMSEGNALLPCFSWLLGLGAFLFLHYPLMLLTCCWLWPWSSELLHTSLSSSCCPGGSSWAHLQSPCAWDSRSVLSPWAVQGRSQLLRPFLGEAAVPLPTPVPSPAFQPGHPQ